jgi:hypothetical protein
MMGVSGTAGLPFCSRGDLQPFLCEGQIAEFIGRSNQSPTPKFPANREINRELSVAGTLNGKSGVKSAS